MKLFYKTSILILLSLHALGQSPSAKLQISRLADNFYVFTSFNYYQGNLIPANGMYLVTRQGVVLFDTPWDSTQFQPLLDSIAARHYQPVVLCLATHFHEDRTGGLAYYRQKGIKTYTTRKTDELSRERGMKRAEYLMDQDTVFRIGDYSFETYYPGPGHTADNIIVWFPRERILYGGCLIKAAGDQNLGNLGDASPLAYAATIEKVIRKCPAPRFVIPGHGDWHNPKALLHTLQLARQLKKTRKQAQ